MWKKDRGSQALIIPLLSPYIKSKFIVDNIVNFEEIFDVEGLSNLEIEADIVNLVGVDFSSTPVPICKTEAYFSIPVRKRFDSIDLARWQEENSPFSDAISFYWDFRDENLEDIDTSYGSNSGVECIPILETPLNHN